MSKDRETNRHIIQINQLESTNGGIAHLRPTDVLSLEKPIG